MRKKILPGPRLNLSNLAKWLLTAGLLLVCVQGMLQLYEVQNFFFPNKYYEIKLNLIKKESPKISQGLTSLQNQLTMLSRLQELRAQRDPAPASRPLCDFASPQAAVGALCNSDSSWQAAIHAAKKKHVYVARKLNYLRLILQSLHRNLEAKLLNIGPGASVRKSGVEETLRQIQEIQAPWQGYNNNLDNSSIKLKKLTECRINSPQTQSCLKEKR
jgi:hypothetical protein